MNTGRLTAALLLLGLVVAPLGTLLWMETGGDHGAPSSVVAQDTSPSPVVPAAGRSVVAQEQPSSAPPVPADRAPAGSAPLPTTAEGLSQHRLIGQLHDAQGAPVVGATVLLQRDDSVAAETRSVGCLPGSLEPWLGLPDPADLLSVVSDGEGRFELSTVLAGAPGSDGEDHSPPRPKLLVTHPDFAPVLHECLPLEDGDHDLGRFSMQRAARVRGRCVDETGQPLAGVLVGADVDAVDWRCRAGGRFAGWGGGCGSGLSSPSAMRWVQPVDRLTLVRSDADGRFELVGLPTEVRRIEAQARGFLPLAPVPVRLSAGGSVDLGELPFVAGQRVTGVVLDDAGRPLVGASVRGAPFPVLAEADAHTAWAGLEAGLESPLLYSSERAQRAASDLVATSDAEGRFELVGLASASLAVLARAEGHDTVLLRDVPVGPGELTLRLRSLATRRVRCVDESGRPLVLKHLGGSAAGAALGWPQRIPSQAARAVDVQAGVWEFDSLCAHALRLVGTLEDGRDTAPAVVESLSTPGDGPRAVTFTVPSQLRLRVVDVAGQPLGSASCSWQLPDQWLRARLQGGVLDAAVPAVACADGPAVLRVAAPGFRSRLLTLPASAGVIDLGDVTLQSAPLVSVLVLDGDRPRAGVKLKLESRLTSYWSPVASATTDVLGRAHLAWSDDGVPGRVRVFTDKHELGDLLEALPEGPPRELDLTLRRAAPSLVTGRVLRDGHPVVAAAVRVEIDGTRRTLKTDERGTFAVTALVAGSAHVWARADDGSLGERLELPLLGAATEPVELSLSGPSFSGRVVGWPDHQPLAWHTLTLEALDDSRSVEVRADAQGHFRIEHVPPGDWTLNARFANGPRLGRVPVTTPATDVTLVFDAQAELTVRLLTARGDPALPSYVGHLTRVGGGERISKDLVSVGTSFSCLPAGRYELIVTGGLMDWLTLEPIDDEALAGLALVRQMIELSPGDDRQLTLQLPE